MHRDPSGLAEAQMEFPAKSSAAAREWLRKLYGSDQHLHKQYEERYKAILCNRDAYLSACSDTPTGTFFGQRSY